MNDKNEKGGKISEFFDKITSFSIKTTKEIQKSAQNLSEKAKQDNFERQRIRLNPIFPKDYKSQSFKIPNIIKIIDDASDKNFEACKGAIGRLEKINNTEILYLYDEWVSKCGLVFVPVAKCNDVFCVDPFDRTRFIEASSTFAKATEEKLAELEHIAFSLGAKRCSIEIVETVEQSRGSNLSLKAKYNNIGASLEGKISASAQNSLSGKTESIFEGSNEPKHPTLKWFANDSNILHLIEMRCSENNGIKSKILQLNGSSSATMSYQTACAIDKLLSVAGTMEKQAIKESNATLIFEIVF